MDAKTKAMAVPLIAGLIVGILVGVALSGTVLGEWSKYSRFSQPKGTGLDLPPSPTGNLPIFRCTSTFSMDCPSDLDVSKKTGKSCTINQTVSCRIRKCSYNCGGITYTPSEGGAQEVLSTNLKNYTS